MGRFFTAAQLAIKVSSRLTRDDLALDRRAQLQLRTAQIEAGLQIEPRLRIAAEVARQAQRIQVASGVGLGEALVSEVQFVVDLAQLQMRVDRRQLDDIVEMSVAAQVPTTVVLTEVAVDADAILSNQ